MVKTNIENKNQFRLFLESYKDINCGNCVEPFSELDKSLAIITHKCPHCNAELQTICVD